MRVRKTRVLVPLAAGVLLLVVAPAPIARGSTQTFEAWHSPPGLILDGATVTLSVSAEPSDPEGGYPTGDAYARAGSQGAFTRLRLTGEYGQLTARVPASLLGARTLEDYVVLRDPASGLSTTIPPEGARAPYRSWIVADPVTVALGTHRFGRVRAPDEVVAQANPGAGPGRVGFSLPQEGARYGPSSFDVGPDGTIWVVDAANTRLLGWDPGHPEAPVRTIPLDFGPSDIAISPDGTLYVSGVKPPDPDLHLRLYAFDPSGRQLWMGRLLTGVLNDHVRVGPDGGLWSVGSQYGWAPALDGKGLPLDVAGQASLVEPYQPVAGGRQLLLSSWDLAGLDWSAGLGTGTNLTRAWRISSANDLNPFLVSTPAVVDGDPVIVCKVSSTDHSTSEYEVLRLAPEGAIRSSFAIPFATWGDVTTSLRVGPDDALYQMQTDPVWGLKIARYALAAAVTPTPSPTSTSPIASPTIAPAPLPTSSGGWPPVAWVAIAIGVLALMGAGAVLARRRGTHHGHVTPHRTQLGPIG